MRRTKLVAVATASLIGAATALSFTSAHAAGATPAASSGDKSTVVRDSFTAGRYVVMLREPSATSYAGTNPRYAATKARPGEQFNASRSSVAAYAAHLRRSQGDVASSVGTRVDQSFTIASNGFSAHLTADQATRLSADSRVLLVQKDAVVHADTWNTPDFLGLTGKNGAWTTHGGQRKAGDGIVIADLDSGIWPESKSFAGAPLTETPKTKWDISRTGTATRMEKSDGNVFNGECEVTADFTADDCNTKLIGARAYNQGYLASGKEIIAEDYDSPRDGNGHGSHTASTAAGDIVDNVKTEGVKFGTVTGMAPAARIAAYKVLWATPDGRASGVNSDIVAAIDDAVSDGADVINFSISGATDTVIDAAEIAFEGAAEAGVFVAASAGNEGPGASTVAHNSPWLTTVAASTHYNFDNTLVLGNGTKIVGASVNKTAVPSSPLIRSADAVVAGGDADDAALCGPDTLDTTAVTGKIVICNRGVYDRVAKSAEVARAGGVGMVLANLTPNSLDADFHSVPTVHIDDVAAKKVFAYVAAKGSAATARIEPSNITNHVTPLPQVAGFSSRGPATANDADLLKPDVAAPGVSVLAAVAPPSNSGRKYDLYSGTSMSAPHIAGLAAFMQGVHPRWTPMQIKSAMMTTATRLKDADGNASNDVFAGGAGQVTPKKFFNPGLFVTSDARQWRGFITGQGLQTGTPALAAKDLNGPSLAQGQVTSATSFTRTFTSTMKGTWKVSVSVPGFTAIASAPTLVSKRRGDIEDLTFDFTRTTAPLGEFAMGWVTLTGPTRVRMPVALRPVSVKAPSSVQGTGVSGSVEVPITAGFSGDLPVNPAGLAKATKIDGTVAVDDYSLECVPVAEGSKLARFDLDGLDDSADLDMIVYHSTSCDPNDIDAQVGSSGSPTAEESVTLMDPEAGSYIVEIDGFSAGQQGSPVPYQLRAYDVSPATALGNLTVTPNPVPVVNQQETSFDVTWTGLDPNEYYLGMLGYDGALAPTLVEITS